MQQQLVTPKKIEAIQTQLGVSNQKSIRRSQSDKRSLHLKSSQHEELLTSSQNKKRNQKLKVRFKTEQKPSSTYDNPEQQNSVKKLQQKNQRFHQDQYGDQSLAELLAFRNQSKDKNKEIVSSQSARKDSEIKIQTDEEEDEGEENVKNSISKEESQSFQQYSLGNQTSVSVSLQKPTLINQLKLYSHKDQLKNICEKQFVVKSQAQKEMEKRYWRGQQKMMEAIRNIKEFYGQSLSYQVDKKKFLQLTKRKLQSKRIFGNQPIRKIQSMPKLPKIAEVEKKIQHIVQNPLQVRMKEIEKKKSKSMKRCCTRHTEKEDTENIEEIEKLLRKKGINFKQESVRKGLTHIKTLPDQQSSEFPEKSLLSNFIYKKYPL